MTPEKMAHNQANMAKAEVAKTTQDRASKNTKAKAAAKNKNQAKEADDQAKKANNKAKEANNQANEANNQAKEANN